MNLCVIRWVEFLSPLYLNCFFLYIEWLVDIIFLKLHMLFGFGVSLWSVFEWVLVVVVLLAEIFFLLLLWHEKGFWELWIFLSEHVFFLGRKAWDVIVETHFSGSFLLLGDFLLWDDFFFLNDFFFIMFLLRNEVFDLVRASLDELGEEFFHVFLVFLLHKLA